MEIGPTIDRRWGKVEGEGGGASFAPPIKFKYINVCCRIICISVVDGGNDTYYCQLDKGSTLGQPDETASRRG